MSQLSRVCVLLLFIYGCSHTSDPVSCSFSLDEKGKIVQFESVDRFPMGNKPRVAQLADERKAGKYRPNPDPRDSDIFLRAASSVQIIKSSKDRSIQFLVAQDSRRKLGVVDLSLKKKGTTISTFPIAKKSQIQRFEDDRRDYKTFRKKHKVDFEAMTTLPTGEILTLSSGSDIDKMKKGEPTFRSLGVITQQNGRDYQSYDLSGFYSYLQEKKELIGGPHEGEPAVLNIEGVSLRKNRSGYIISFFHRGNMNNNGHNGMVEFDFSQWYQLLSQSTLGNPLEAKLWESLTPLNIKTFDFPMIANLDDPNGSSTPLTLNDAIFGKIGGVSSYIIPVGAEADFIDSQGNHQDGVVTFAGLAVWKSGDDLRGDKCVIIQAAKDPEPGKPSIYGKTEGLTAIQWLGSRDPVEQHHFSLSEPLYGVTDIDSEVTPSVLSVIKLPTELETL